jgi:hypothetical protein
MTADAVAPLRMTAARSLVLKIAPKTPALPE